MPATDHTGFDPSEVLGERRRQPFALRSFRPAAELACQAPPATGVQMNRRRLTLVLIPLLAALALTACGGGHDESAGSVTQLRFTPAHDADVKVNDYTTVCFPAGKTVVCTEQYAGWHWETRHHPDKWVAYAFNCDRHGCWDFHHDIDQSVYCHLRPGFWLDFDHPAVYLDLSDTTLREEASCHGAPAT